MTKPLFRLVFVGLYLLVLTGCGGGGGLSASTSNVLRINTPVFESPLNIASDSAIIRIDASTLHMYYTAENAKIALVISTDNGQSWQHPTDSTVDDFAVLTGRPANWDKILETVDVVKVDNEYWMYYTGYRDGESDNTVVENYQVGLAISTDGGMSFTRTRDATSMNGPIIPMSASDDMAMDRHAITSPSVVLDNGVFYMVYTGWNTTDNFSGPGAGIWTLGATSVDGISWTKQAGPLLQLSDVSWADGSINESDIYLSSDGTWHFVFTAEEGIGLGRATTPFGPYTFSAGPLFSAQYDWEIAEIVAPNVIVEDGILVNGSALRIWYTGIETDAFYPAVVGYAEAPYP